jgi:hypothetical protein
MSENLDPVERRLDDVNETLGEIDAKLQVIVDFIGSVSPNSSVDELGRLQAQLSACETDRDRYAREANAQQAETERVRKIAKAIVWWLKRNQPDVFSRGLWDAM